MKGLKSLICHWQSLQRRLLDFGPLLHNGPEDTLTVVRPRNRLQKSKCNMNAKRLYRTESWTMEHAMRKTL